MKYRYIYKDGDCRDLYVAGEQISGCWHRYYTIIKVTYDPITDKTTVKARSPISEVVSQD